MSKNKAKKDDLSNNQLQYIKSIEDEYIKGFHAKSKIGSIKEVTIYGSARLPADDQDYKDIVKIGEELRKEGWAIVTGGGPGIMSAALANDNDDILDTIAYNITIAGEEAKSPADLSLIFDHFSVRKDLLRSSDVFIVAPGGFGTMDELMELATLIKTGKKKSVPIYLYNSKFWKGLIDWFRDTMLARGTIDQSHIDMLEIVDTPEELIKRVLKNK